ncbi:MAG TPA: acyl-CoA dehydrogenase, partial [Massilia sp.]|nr:acyl-CoA dehydrogenase [Massilia sp.]
MSDTESFRREVRQWLEQNCPPSMRTPIVPDEMVWGGSQVQFRSEDQRLWFERMRERGWFAPGWPRAYGGGGLGPKKARIVQQEKGRPRR